MKLNGGQALIKALEMEGRRGHLRPARRGHPPGVRPDHRLADPPHPRAPRAGRRPHGRGLRPRHRQARRGHGHQRPGRHQHRHPAGRRLHGLRAHGLHHRPGAAPPAIGTDAFQEADITGITQSVTKHNFLVTAAPGHPAWSSARRSTSPPPAGPGPVLVDIPKDIVDPTNPRSRHGVVLADRRRGGGRPARLPAHHHRPPRADQGGGRADPGRRAPGHLRRRRHPQGPGRRGAAGAGRAARHPRRHHADGPRRLPRRPPAVPRHAGHARQLHRRSCRCRRPTC